MATDITIRVLGDCSPEHMDKVAGILAKSAKTYTGAPSEVVDVKHEPIPAQRDVTSAELTELVAPYTQG